jgi:hypothetical protein
MTGLSKKRLADILERLNGTTHGPWHCADGEWEVYAADGSLIVDCAPIATVDEAAANARFIAHSRSDVEWLCTQLAGEKTP